MGMVRGSAHFNAFRITCALPSLLSNDFPSMLLCLGRFIYFTFSHFTITDHSFNDKIARFTILQGARKIRFFPFHLSCHV